MKTELVPATQSLHEILSTLADLACGVKRNCQTAFTLLCRARDVLDCIHERVLRSDDPQLEDGDRWRAFNDYNEMIDVLDKYESKFCRLDVLE